MEARIEVNGHALQASISGSGPVIVLNSGGGVGGVGRWAPIESSLTRFAKVVCYDRAGTGRSASPNTPPDVGDMTEDLAALLRELEVPKPVILVGWSLSGLMVQLFASRYPLDTAGLLLLDPTPDDMFEGFGSKPAAMQASIRDTMLEASTSMGSTPSMKLEFNRFPESCELVRSAFSEGSKVEVPVIIISAGLAPVLAGRQIAGTLQKAHARLLTRFSRGQHVIAEHSSHTTILDTDPELVVNSLRSLIAQSELDQEAL